MSRYYNIDNKDYVSVTTVLKDVFNAPGLNNWRVKEGIKSALEQVKINPNITSDEILKIKKDELDKSGERGTNVHTLIANAKSQKIDVNTVLTPEYKGYIECYNKWIDDVKPLPPIITEEKVYNPELYYAGTLDGVYPVYSQNILTDIKTGFVNEITGLQLTAYEYALLLNKPDLKIHEKRILKLSSDGSYDINKNWILTNEPFENWKQLLNLWWCYYASKKYKTQWGHK